MFSINLIAHKVCLYSKECMHAYTANNLSAFQSFSANFNVDHGFFNILLLRVVSNHVSAYV